jgi:hypothetical protein
MNSLGREPQGCRQEKTKPRSGDRKMLELRFTPQPMICRPLRGPPVFFPLPSWG